MEDCFRFLINTDQCLNMSNFGMFFYKLENEHKIHISDIQLTGPSRNNQLRKAAMAIRTCLDRFPYYVGDYQVIVTMRSDYREKALEWRDTLLYRLIRLDHELRNARIFINSKEKTDKALNLIMLYDADFTIDLPDVDNYLNSERYADDFKLMLKEFGLEINETKIRTDSIISRLNEYNTVNGADTVTSGILSDIVASIISGDAVVQKETAFSASQKTDVKSGWCDNTIISRAFREMLDRFNVFELLIDRNDMRRKMYQLLKVVEYINMSVETPANEDIGQVSLAERSKQLWKKISTETGNDCVDLEAKYSEMLYNYRQRLESTLMNLQTPTQWDKSLATLPDMDIPGDNSIKSSSNVFSSDNPNDQGSDLRKILDRFYESKFSIKSIVSGWDGVYKRLTSVMSSMEAELKSFAEDLSNQYSSILEKRKLESLVHKKNVYVANANTEKDISKLKSKKEELLNKLKNPHMNPSLNFQDQLNMENSLELAHQEIRFYSECISKATAASFLLMTVVCFALFVMHYTLLQPYVFKSMDSYIFYMIYAAVAFVTMLLSWRMPHNYFRRRIKAVIERLKADMNTYIDGYFEKAEYFIEYINLINQLDYVTRRLELYCRAKDCTNRLSAGYLWHKVQIKYHLEKLQFFSGLIELFNNASGDSTEYILPDITGDRVSSVVESRIYWPQQ